MRNRLAALGLLPNVQAPYPLAANIDPSPWGAIEAIYQHPETLVDNDPELWSFAYEWRALSYDYAWRLDELEARSGWECDAWNTAVGTKARMLQYERDSKNDGTT